MFSELPAIIKALPKEGKIKILKRLQAGELTVTEAIHSLKFRLDGMAVRLRTGDGGYLYADGNNVLYTEDEFNRMRELTGQSLEGCTVIGFGVWEGFEYGWNSKVFTFANEETKQKYYHG